jgi:hypothetical protein
MQSRLKPIEIIPPIFKNSLDGAVVAIIVNPPITAAVHVNARIINEPPSIAKGLKIIPNVVTCVNQAISLYRLNSSSLYGRQIVRIRLPKRVNNEIVLPLNGTFGKHLS